MAPHSQGYMELNRPLSIVKQWGKAATKIVAAGAALAVAGAAAYGFHVWRQETVVKPFEEYKKSPVVLTCKHPLTGAVVPVREADVNVNPGIVSASRRDLTCG